MICTVANASWAAGCVPDAYRFARATRRVREAQTRVLRDILRANEACEFGLRHGFASIGAVSEYRHRVPIRGYEDIERDVARVAAGEGAVLTSEAVRLFEPTSGSVSGTKLIPYTRSLERQFRRAIGPWVVDLFRRYPDLLHGQAYWSISPVMALPSRTAGGVAIGFEDDSAYVGGWQRKLVQTVMAAPSSLRSVKDATAFRYATLLALVRSSSLRLISIWNPSFLRVIVDSMPEHADSLLRDLADSPARASTVRAALAASTPAERHTLLWPRLCVLSCWADGNAAGPARDLAALFPQACMQPKGLIATEGFISLPLTGCDGAALAVRSHFVEFAGIDSHGCADESSMRLAHELEPGRRYAVVITTAGGLYRYRLNDVVEVVGRVRECPLVRFIGKHEYVSDWFGEKLHEAHVSSALSAILDRPSFAMLACDADLSPPAYVLYVQSGCGDAELVSASAALDDRLRQNFHYDYARLLGQLGPVSAFRVEHGADTYLSIAEAGGQRPGGIKLLALDRRAGWSRRFTGHFIPTPSRSTPCGSALLRRVR